MVGCLLRSPPRCWRCMKYLSLCCTIIYVATFLAVLNSSAIYSTVNIKPVFNITTLGSPNITVQTTPKPTTSYTGPVMVIILTYQRSGSTFLGQIFNRNPSAFYSFEPLDGLYSAIYGTSQGYNAPSDILQHWNGTRRFIPDFEVRSSATVMENLLTCQHSLLPTEMIACIFWVGFMSEHLTVSKYVDCFRKHKILDSCRGRLRKSCKIWFGQKGSNQSICRQELWDDTSPSNWSQRKEFKAYKACAASHRKKASVCFPHLTSACDNAEIRSAKTVRLSMRAVEILLKKYPHHKLKVLHLLRDPKAVAVSRMKYESVRGHFSGKNKTREAMNLCQNIKDDLDVRETLEQRYPGVFHQVIYEDFIRNPVNMTREIYAHIGKQVPVAVERFFESRTSLNNTKPLTNITRTEAYQIDHICEDMYARAGYSWPLTLPGSVTRPSNNATRRTS